MRFLLLCAFAALASGCGGAVDKARVKGQLTENNEIFRLPPGAGEVFIVFRFIGADDQPDQRRMYTAKVYDDGRFEVVSSGGELPVGKYQVAIDAAAGRVEQFKAFAMPDSPARIEFKSGSNNVKIDIAKPNG
jgi:hypothetical protein